MPRDLALARLPDQVISPRTVDPHQLLMMRLMQTFLWVTERECSSAKKCRELAMAHTLVPGDHVETASVYGSGDEKIGTIERLMLEKKSGTVAYAVVRCGGLLKGEVRHYPCL